MLLTAQTSSLRISLIEIQTCSTKLGVRHSLRDPTVLISQRIEDVPFDLRPYAVHIYDWKTNAGRKSFRQRMKEVIRSVDGEPGKATSPVRKYLKL